MAGYSGTPLAKKLGIKEGHTVLLVNEPVYYESLFEDYPKVKKVDLSSDDIDFIHFFVKDKRLLEGEFMLLKSKLKKDGSMWIFWPKKSSKVETTVDEGLVRKTGLDGGLVDVKICAVNEVWSGLKFVYRKEDR